MNVSLLDFYSRLGTVAIILALGFSLGRLELISPKTNKDLVNLLLTVFMPASLFMAFPTTYSDETSHIFIAGLVGGFIVMIAITLLSLVIFNKKWYKGISLCFLMACTYLSGKLIENLSSTLLRTQI